jgi:hypothetical protein
VCNACIELKTNDTVVSVKERGVVDVSLLLYENQKKNFRCCFIRPVAKNRSQVYLDLPIAIARSDSAIKTRDLR